ncbi:MAG: alpha/beta fold hydrolase [Gammaproteobacteria bacterium]|nr:alpha/beta fold hydrolase [Gammaproteobacteria bacterium]MDE0273982.1 alpha/beta fold hydrolase [Gammaproteobacteria bacterium]
MTQPPSIPRPANVHCLVGWRWGFALALLLPGASAAFDLSPCVLKAAEGRIEVKAECGYLSALLNPADEGGKAIDLFVAVVPTVAAEPAEDALTVVAGGPGQASTEFFAAAARVFRRIGLRRDIVLVDQRGTGRSAKLDCPNPAEEGLAWTAGSDVDKATAHALECLASLTEDPRYFTTSVAVADLERVRAALGYPQLNLYGISYGTRVAQHYLRRHPQRVRRLILDSLVPPPLALGPDVGAAGQAALDAIFARCAADEACARSFPDLEQRFQEVLRRLEAAPVDVHFQHPISGQPMTESMDRTVVAAVTRLLLYSPNAAATLPVLIQDAYEGRYERLASRAASAFEALEDIAEGLNFAVVCTEDAPFWGELHQRGKQDTFMGSGFMDTLVKVCASWPSGLIDDDFKAPLTSDAPTLVLSGEFDPITPPRYLELMGNGLTNRLSIVAPGQGHGVLAASCVPRLMAEFIEADEPLALDTACIDRAQPSPLFLSPMGPGS